MEIRPTAAPDLDSILRVHREAFGSEEGPVIADLVRDLFEDPSALPIFSFLASDEGTVIGHILFTRVRIDEARNEGLSAQILAPLAVIPGRQSKGTGLSLVEYGLAQLALAGTDLVFVLGHPGYYPKAGFSPALPAGLAAPYPIEEKNIGAWMVKDLRGGLVGNVRGTVRCADVLDRAEHWSE